MFRRQGGHSLQFNDEFTVNYHVGKILSNAISVFIKHIQGLLPFDKMPHLL